MAKTAESNTGMLQIPMHRGNVGLGLLLIQDRGNQRNASIPYFVIRLSFLQYNDFALQRFL